MLRFLLPVNVLCVWLMQCCGAQVFAAEPNYEDDIKPLFRTYCLKCHNSDEANADLDLSSYAAAMKGGSAGVVLQAGRPESSQLYRAMAHSEGVEAMPPESPKLSDQELQLVSDWIRGGLLAGKGAKSQLRSMSKFIASAAPGAKVPLPTNLPEVEITSVLRSPIPQAIAASPGANLLAVSGQQQILLYSPERTESHSERQPVAEADIIRRWDFDDSTTVGKSGNAMKFTEDAAVATRKKIAFDTFEQLTVSTWLKPTAGQDSQTIFGQPDGFTLYLERRRNGWTPRLMLRDQGNGVNHYGRVAFVPDDRWSLLAVTWNGSAFRWYVNGELVGEQPSSDRLKNIQQRDGTEQSLGGIIRQGKTEQPFHGVLDDLRLYRRALDDKEAKQMLDEIPSQVPQFGLLGALPFPMGTVHDLKFSRTGTILLAAGGRGAHSGQVLLYEVATGEVIQKIGDEVDSVLAADITPQHDFVALGGPGKLVKIFDTKSGELAHRIQKHTDWITAVSFSTDGRLLATGDRSGGIHIWETGKGAIVFTLDEHKVRISDLAWRSDDKVLVSVSEDGNMILWDMKDGFPIRNTVAHSSESSSRYSRKTGVVSVDFAADGTLLTAGRDGFARRWNADAEQQGSLPITEGLPTAAVFLTDANAAVIGSFDGSLHLWDIKENRKSQMLSLPTGTTVASENAGASQ